MEHIAPLIQTVLWVGLIVWIVFRYHVPIYGLLSALQKRVESGSSVKAGPFELGDQFRPQAPTEQKKRIEAELLESLPEATEPNHLRSTGQEIFLAEDLALRAIQAEYGKAVSRQVTTDSEPDFGFDGVFTLSGRLHIVEVKFVRNRQSISRIRDSLLRIENIVSNHNWKNVQIVLAVVFQREEDVPSSDTLLLNTAQGLSLPVAIRPFSMLELRRRFGAG